MKIPIEFATHKQVDYIDILAIDLGFNLRQRNFYMKRIVNHPVDAPSELTKGEASKVIERFLEYKENNATLIEMDL